MTKAVLDAKMMQSVHFINELHQSGRELAISWHNNSGDGFTPFESHTFYRTRS